MIKVIGEHLLREGKIDVAQQLQEETGVEIDMSLIEHFQKMAQIVEDLKNRNTTSAIEWVEKEAENLQSINSQLLFQLHKLAFTSIAIREGPNQAVAYARKYFLQFELSENNNDIPHLMASLLYLTDMQKSPYSHLYQQDGWEKVQQMLMRDSCKLYEIPPDSPLYIVVTAGTLSLPSFLKLSSILKTNEDWKRKNEIPIDIEVGKNFKFHSLFVCPVSKEVSPATEPPMLLKCGHAISSHSLKKMTGHGQRNKFKCPTCQTQQNHNDAKKIYF